jgi:hypothetical protein
MRKQYYFQPSQRGYLAWDVDRLISLTRGLRSQPVALSRIQELDNPFAMEGSADVPTYREVAEHARLIEEADLGFPIILSSKHRVMDGMHRVMKALNAGRSTIDAVIFERDPAPDYVDVSPDELPY